MPIKVHEISSFSDYVRKISTLRRNNGILWFRGMSKESYSLIPSLFRRAEKPSRGDYGSIERSLLNRFQERSLPYQNKTFSNDWAWLFFMQHYGIPTRLLDWTENPFVALFFAIINCDKKPDRSYKTDSVVWILNPVTWNRSVLSFQGFDGEILGITDSQLKPFTPPADFGSIPDYALAMNGFYNSTRIAAQRGTFLIFGKPEVAMEKYFEEKISTDCLQKIIIKKESIAEIRDEVVKSGITESVVFPDLDGLAKELKRQFGYEER
jgi:hypothetical protein